MGGQRVVSIWRNATDGKDRISKEHWGPEKRRNPYQKGGHFAVLHPSEKREQEKPNQERTGTKRMMEKHKNGWVSPGLD